MLLQQGVSEGRTSHALSTNRSVRYLVINMHECPVHTRQCLKLILQVLRHVVGFPKWRVTRHDDVDFDHVVRWEQ